jgi:hypothetical protein
MKLRKRKSLILVAAVLAVLTSSAAFWSCDNTFHVFDDIQTEVRQVGTDIFKNATVKALGDDGTNYYAAMAKIWYRPIASGDWKVLPVSGNSDYSSYSLASDPAGSAVYAAVDKSGTPAVYKGTTAGTVWTAIPLGSLAGLSLDELYFANGELFALAHAGTGDSIKYSLHYSNGAAAFAATNLANLASPLLGLAWDGTNYLAPISSKVYTATADTGPWTDATPAGDKSFGGIAADNAGDIHLSTRDGYLYTWSGSWSAAKTVKAKQALGMVAEVETSPGAGVYRLLIAHGSTGYYEFNAGSSTAIDGDDSATAFGTPASAYTTTIYGKSVLAVHSSSTGNEILIGLASQGTSTSYALYSNKYSSGSWSGWSAE